MHAVRELSNMEPIKAGFILVIVLVLICFAEGNATADGKWFVSLYGGQATDGSEKDVFTIKADYGKASGSNLKIKLCDCYKV